MSFLSIFDSLTLFTNFFFSIGEPPVIWSDFRCVGIIYVYIVQFRCYEVWILV